MKVFSRCSGRKFCRLTFCVFACLIGRRSQGVTWHTGATLSSGDPSNLVWDECTLTEMRNGSVLVTESSPTEEALIISQRRSTATLPRLTPRNIAGHAPDIDDLLPPSSVTATPSAAHEQIQTRVSPRGSQRSSTGDSPRRVTSFPSPWFKESAYLKEACGLVTRRTHAAVSPTCPA